MIAGFEGYLSEIERQLKTIIDSRVGELSQFYRILQYQLGQVDEHGRVDTVRYGKRIRPLLCILSCEAAGGRRDVALPTAAAIELIHNFSLIHDDVQDRSATRRHRPTVWKLCGVSQAINAGDAMFSLAFSTITLDTHSVDENLEILVEVIQVVADACIRIAEGQYLDICFEGRARVTLEDYLKMIEAKTAQLIGCATYTGGRLGGASVEEAGQYRRFGHYLGMAYQIQDDFLGIWGDPEVTGKPVGIDLAQRKKTLPLIHGLERSTKLRSLLAQETLSEADVQRATRLLEETGSRSYAEQLAREHHEQALAALDRANPQHPAGEALRELAQRLLNRRR